jgi:putative membrane protein
VGGDASSNIVKVWPGVCLMLWFEKRERIFMRIVAKTLIGLIALLHLYIAWFEIFAWESRGPNIFSSFPADLFGQTVEMAANQGIYNAFLAAGLIWALTIKDAKWFVNVATCFLPFVAVAGVFGAATVTVKTLMIQTVPAGIALVLLWMGKRAT